MRRMLQRRWLAAGAGLTALGGCVTDPQLVDFAFTEVARLLAGYVGVFVDTLLQATGA